jgi:protease PrsW
MPIGIGVVAAGAGTALSLAVLLAAVYFIVIRFLDLNEKEPLWAMGLVFACGVVVAQVLYLLVPSTTLELDRVAGPLLKTAAILVAVAAGIAALTAIGRWRGWSEFDGLLDGVVYGMSAGLGFATGAVLAQEFLLGMSSAGAMSAAGPLEQFWPLALAGLSLGLFGALIGAGFGAAITVEAQARKILYVVGGALVTAGLHVGYVAFARGASLTGSAALVRTWIALLVPLAVVASIVIGALISERRIINRELPAEVDAGAVTEEELGLLRSFTQRRSAYLALLFRGHVEGWMALKALHNRQVQLAFTLARHRKTPRADFEAEAERLRASIVVLRQQVRADGSAAKAPEGIGA